MKKGGAKAKKFIVNSIVHVGLGIMAFIWLLPIVWVIITSFRDEKGAYFRWSTNRF